MLQWFRRKVRKDEPAAVEAAAPTPEVVEERPAEAGETDARRKRRRGSRGGRTRAKRTGEAQPVERERAAPEREPSAPAKARRPRARRRPPPRRPALPPAKRELLVSVAASERRVAVLEDDRVAEVYLERPERRSIAGNIYKGTVDNVLPGMEAAFVQIGLDKNGFLYVDEIVTPELEGRGHGRKIQDLLSRGQEILVQAVKDPMKTKGARLTTEISLPGRFLVYVPNGEGLGVSRRLEDDERVRLREILKDLSPPSGGIIVRTAAEGASAEDVERDLDFLQRLWTSIQARAQEVKAPALVYQEAELPLRVVRDLFKPDFERALVDDDRTYKRIVGYLKKTSPEMAERVTRYRDKEPLFEAFAVESEIRSTLSRRVDLPSGGYLVFDYAEAFTVIDVNTGRFVGSRSKSSGARLEDTITKNNLEAVKEVVRQLRLRDIGGIIVIDFIDMANPKNRATVEEALKEELERDRTKTYVVEISPLGLVEMTRQNVTDGPREILTARCPTCNGDGIVLSEASAVVDAERRLQALAAGSRRQAFRVELNARVANRLIGPGATRLVEIEARAKRRFLLEPREDVPLDHFVVLAQGTVAELAPESPVAEGADIRIELVEVGLHDASAGVGKLDGYAVEVAEAARLVGKKVKARIERVLDGTAYATLVGAAGKEHEPITAEAAAEKPTRQPRRKKVTAAEPQPPEVVEAAPLEDAVVEDEREEAAEDEKPKKRTRQPRRKEVAVAELQPPEAVEAAPLEDAVVEDEREEAAEDEKPKKRTRRGSRGGRGRRRKTVAAGEVASDGGGPPEADAPAPRIHVPDPALGAGEAASEEAPAAPDGEQPPAARKRTRRGSRGGRNRRKKAVAGVAEAGEETASGE